MVRPSAPLSLQLHGPGPGVHRLPELKGDLPMPKLLVESEIKPYDFQLAGVAFYQLADTDDGVATVRFHGPRSIYERLLPQVRNWL